MSDHPRPGQADTAAEEASGLRLHRVTVHGPGGQRVLGPLDVTVPPGRLVALCGPSGSGKTTLLLVSLGAPAPALVVSGAASWRGRPVPVAAAARRWRRAGVGVITQESGPSLLPRRTALSTVLEAAPAARRRELRTRALSLLDRLGLPLPIAGQLAGTLSSGQAQRVALARAVLLDPPLVVADEPTRGLDQAAAAAVRDLLREQAAAGAAVLVATHDLVLAELADAVVHLARVRPPGPPTASSRRVTTPADGGPLLDVRGLQVQHQLDGGGEATVFDDVSFTLRPGERVAVVGPSGAGKTTLLRALAGLHPPSRGRIELEGSELPSTAAARTTAQRGTIQLVAQDASSALNPAHRAVRSVQRPLQVLQALPPRSATARALDILAATGLDAGTAQRRPQHLSGGERSRVVLARALAAPVRVLLVDEPTAALDAATRSQVLALLAALCDSGAAVLVTTHDEHVIAWADRSIEIADDIAEDPPSRPSR